MPSSVTHVAAGQGLGLQVLGDVVTLKGRLDPGGFVLAEIAVPPGSGVPLHRHASAEIFAIGEGVVELLAGETLAGATTLTARAGDVVSVPGGAAHGYRNPGSAPARMHVTIDARMEAFFRAVGSSAAPPGPPGPETVARVLALAAAHGIEMLEGPPDR